VGHHCPSVGGTHNTPLRVADVQRLYLLEGSLVSTMCRPTSLTRKTSIALNDSGVTEEARKLTNDTPPIPAGGRCGVMRSIRNPDRNEFAFCGENGEDSGSLQTTERKSDPARIEYAQDKRDTASDREGPGTYPFGRAYFWSAGIKIGPPMAIRTKARATEAICSSGKGYPRTANRWVPWVKNRCISLLNK